ncbi:enoyl-CoA hydratase [Nannizzia gypsea CBS 118893]|uniref:Probable enoyl-CoA hydratase, mitochondrial n=1 Tax=Arthroderma gypseum (strain ATCC MYA-4604 / CBS 118893) TaxID=535722 RepID=E4UYE5_ARTGP|nr:enoyl-CoA hydratase [Nannizzia gypsea CBS 118893]EFR02108.1 enoyl-CoA hydratase [Nannizzia gypsea CBS 118893]
MFARRCSRLVASQTARPLQSYISRFYSTGSPAYEYILTSTPKPGVALITLNRPKALNALCSPLFKELNEALTKYDEDKSIGAIVITGSEKAFAAGADIKEMAPLTFAAAYNDNFIAPWSHLANTIRTPVIAAVSGYALGGGCELAMMCDMIYCTDKATFGQPEIKLGTIPGAGGSQRLTKLVGKSKAMELILTGNTFSGKEAGEWGVAAKVVEGGKDELMEATLETASKIASYSRVAVVAAKEVVNKSQELSLKEGVEFERRLFHGLFGSKDQKIGMTAFAEKKKPEWSHE